ncbi:MAG TPA: DUF488 domain-containing protein [Gemmatimonadales bacterium]|nr:DUF488 domain-containing protein [Gemmatimonadales bacterium]
MNLPFFTIGHSTRSIDEFVELLRSAEVSVVADVRRIPMSRTNPQFNKTALPATLERFQIGYQHLAALGGRRPKSTNPSGPPNTFWQNPSFRNYADYALSPDFRAGVDNLIALGHLQRCAIMCAEAVWWRCHRRIIADYLLARHETVFHLMGTNRIEPARLTSGAIIQPDETVMYPAVMTEA